MFFCLFFFSPFFLFYSADRPVCGLLLFLPLMAEPGSLMEMPWLRMAGAAEPSFVFSVSVSRVFVTCLYVLNK